MSRPKQLAEIERASGGRRGRCRRWCRRDRVACLRCIDSDPGESDRRVQVDDDAEVAVERATDDVTAELPGNREQIRSVLSRTAAVGTVEDVAVTLQQYVEAGVQHFGLSCCAHDGMVDQADRVMAEVAPRLIG